MNLKALIENALNKAFIDINEEDSSSNRPRERSIRFVKELAKGFKKEYHDDEQIFVLSKYDPENIDSFGLNELLFDILVCKTGKLKSFSRKKDLIYIKKSLWQVESEFAKDSRQVVYDFNKLVLGASENKLFIGQQPSKKNEYLDMLALVAKNCQGSVYLALLPYPDKWNNDRQIRSWVFDNHWRSY